jgi:hypothetical protein
MVKKGMRNKIKILLVIVLVFNLVPIIENEAESNESSSFSFWSNFQDFQQDEYEDWVPENLTQDLLEMIAGVIYKGDGTGLLEVLFSLVPIIGSDPAADALLVPIFILLFTGVYWKMKKMGYID